MKQHHILKIKHLTLQIDLNALQVGYHVGKIQDLSAQDLKPTDAASNITDAMNNAVDVLFKNRTPSSFYNRLGC